MPLGRGLAVAATLLAVSAATGPPLPPAAPSGTTAPTTPRRFCQNWYSNRAPNCYQTGLVRVHQALEDENCAVALQSPNNAQMVGGKLLKLKDDTAFVFLRGTAALFYYDMFCEDRTFVSVQSNPHLFVVSNGDCHPENFGNLMMSNGNISFAVNDFDQAFRAPFTWDLKRGAVGFILACQAKELAEAVCRAAVFKWLQGYQDVVSGNCRFTNHDRLVEGARYLDRPVARMVKDLMQNVRRKFSRENGHRKWLSKKVDMTRLRFRETATLKPLGQELIPAFQEVLMQYLFSGVLALVFYPVGHSFWRVLDVARKLDSGTGSLGQDRYWILLAGENNEPRILMMKQVVTGVMEKYLNQQLTDYNEMFRAFSIVKSTQRFQNIFYGVSTYNGLYFIIREQSPFKSSVDIEGLDADGFVDYAYVTGRAQAMLHVSAGCASPQCPLDEEASVDRQACYEVSQAFVREPNLLRSLAEVSFLAAARHVQYHKELVDSFRNCPFLNKEPVMVLSHTIVGRCENVTDPGSFFPVRSRVTR